MVIYVQIVSYLFFPPRVMWPTLSDKSQINLYMCISASFSLSPSLSSHTLLPLQISRCGHFHWLSWIPLGSGEDSQDSPGWPHFANQHPLDLEFLLDEQKCLSVDAVVLSPLFPGDTKLTTSGHQSDDTHPHPATPAAMRVRNPKHHYRWDYLANSQRRGLPALLPPLISLISLNH